MLGLKLIHVSKRGPGLCYARWCSDSIGWCSNKQHGTWYESSNTRLIRVYRLWNVPYWNCFMVVCQIYWNFHLRIHNAKDNKYIFAGFGIYRTIFPIWHFVVTRERSYSEVPPQRCGSSAWKIVIQKQVIQKQNTIQSYAFKIIWVEAELLKELLIWETPWDPFHKRFRNKRFQ